AGEAKSAARADLLARAAIDAGIAQEPERRERLLAKAEDLDPNCVRTRLERLDDDLPAKDQLAYLADLETEDLPLASLVAARRALAHLLASDLEGAAAAAKRAEELDPDSIAVQIVQVNFDLQAARLALLGDRPFVVSAVLAAHEKALGLRERLLAMGRFEES